jgi:hypothetical protein
MRWVLNRMGCKLQFVPVILILMFLCFGALILRRSAVCRHLSSSGILRAVDWQLPKLR